jgi:PAS domain S-box-containing protein
MATDQLTDCRILIVDDTDANVLLLEGVLQQGGYTNVRSVLDSRQAVATFTEYEPDLVLLDLMMPHLDGFAVLERLQPLLANQPYLPIVVLTANVSPEAKRRALASGANDFLTKPLDAVEILLRVKNLLETRLLYLRQQQRADDRIKEQAALIDRASDAIFVLDPQNRVTFWNRGAEVVFHWTAEEVVGRDAHALLFPGAQPHLEEAGRTLRESGKWSGELRPVARDGSELTVASRWTLLTDAGGRPKCTLVICTDVTEKKNLEAHLLRVQRLESIGLLAGGIAHDLNNVLAPILMAVDLLQLNRGVPSSLVATLRSSAQRGTALVKQILTFARGGDDRAEPMHLRHLVGEVVQLAQQTFPRSITFSADVPPDLWLVQGDATQLHQVLMNLCVNARDAMPDGGDLRLSCRNVEVGPAHAGVAVGQPGRYVVLAVQDTGTGIAREVADKIFDPFFTTKEAGKGTGLGLAMVEAIVKKHGGFVRVATEMGKGSCFDMYLPALTDAAPAPAVPAPQPWPTGHGELILVVDDEAGLRRMVAMMLEATGYRVMTAQHGAEALALYEQHRDRIGVVLTDMTMPLMDGATMLRALRALDPQVRIIAASGGEANVPGAQAYLRKPYSAKRLLEAVREVLSPS